jgi:transcriptional regulator with XRE-family HTH domain
VADDPQSLGARLRSRRRALRLTLAEVAAGARVSEGFLSQLERDLNTASIATLQRICGCLQMNVGELFTERSTTALHRFREAHFNPFGSNARKVRITPTTNSQLESFIGEFGPHGTTGDELYVHGDSEEVLLVIAGRLEVTVGERIEVLNALDSIAYSSSVPHRAREIDGHTAIALWVMSPPSY